jgi:hypothetical protein
MAFKRLWKRQQSNLVINDYGIGLLFIHPLNSMIYKLAGLQWYGLQQKQGKVIATLWLMSIGTRPSIQNAHCRA